MKKSMKTADLPVKEGSGGQVIGRSSRPAGVAAPRGPRCAPAHTRSDGPRQTKDRELLSY